MFEVLKSVIWHFDQLVPTEMSGVFIREGPLLEYSDIASDVQAHV